MDIIKQIDKEYVAAELDEFRNGKLIATHNFIISRDEYIKLWEALSEQTVKNGNRFEVQHFAVKEEFYTAERALKNFTDLLN